jgi:ABC-type molybdate transport system substrate-binding protein
MNPGRGILFGSLLAIAGLAALLFLDQRRPAAPRATRPLLVYCAAGMKGPVEAAAKDYERETGVPVQLQFGGSGTLLGNLRVSRLGDLFVAADGSFIDAGRSNQLLAEVLPLARLQPVLAVARGNPRGLHGIDDLLRDGVRVALANPDSVAVGAATRRALTHAGKWAPLAARATVFKPTVNDVANDVKLGSVDAGIVWDATAAQYPELEPVALPEFDGFVSEVSVAVLRCCEQPTAALGFARYLAARDRGLRRFSAAGFRAVDGDVWNPSPEVLLYSGTVNRVAIEDTLREFEQREGARVTRVYNGCGILTAQIKSGIKPDAYFACDVSFMDTVSNRFQPAVVLAETPLVLLVKKGNPSGISGLADLARTGLRVGLANEGQSALGALSARLLRNAGLRERVLANASVQSPTGDLLVNQLRSGALDVALVYAANASQVRDSLDAVPLHEPGSVAFQPYAIGLDSGHARLMGRLLDALEAAPSRERFEKAGFRWNGPGRMP